MALQDDWSLIEADFQREYRLDLRVEFGTAGARRLHTLIVGLSPESAFIRRGKVWTLRDELTALSTEMLVGVWAEDAPERLLDHPDRPPLPDRRKRTSDPDQIKRFLMGR